MKTLPCLVTLALVSLSTAHARAQVAPTASPEHQWLHKFVGQWDSTSQAIMGPGQPSLECKGTMTFKKLGDMWVIAEMEADMMGQKIKALQTIGYDPIAKKYVGTWIDSMLNHMWRYSGTVDAADKKLTLEAEGPNFASPGTTAKFRDEYEFKSNDHIVATSSMLGEDGKWITFMTGDMRRVK